MGNSDETKPPITEKSSPPPQDQPSIHVYPDWAAMQAYYGPRVAVAPYFNSAIASGHAPHPYMWGAPQPMLPPFGVPYAAIYAHGSVYRHPGFPLATTPYMETPAKSSGHKDQSLMKKLKGFDGLAMSVGNGNADSAECGANHSESQSAETEGSSDRSNGNTAGAGQNGSKRSREETLATGGDGKTETQSSSVPASVVDGARDKDMDVNVSPSIAGNVVGTVIALELKNSPIANAKTSPTTAPQSCAVMPNEAWLQDERELKRERRKQSNRESARRSRLRKQAEAEELAVKVESLIAENITIKSEINRMSRNSEILKLENAMLMDKLKNARGQMEEVLWTEVDEKRAPVGTENLLFRVNDSGSFSSSDEGCDLYNNNSNLGTKLHQLLDKSPRTDAVATG
ncbi:Common plant regulatory factor [Sarracenia purpurea var. burkii]